MHAILSVLLAVGGVAAPQTRPTAPENPFVGHWTANLSRSTLHQNSQVQTMTLQFAVTVDAVSITDSVITPSGQAQGHGTTTFQTDGKQHPHDELIPGLTVVARWRGSRILETVLTRKDGRTDRVTYEVSADGRTLTSRTSGDLGDQLIMFDRK